MKALKTYVVEMIKKLSSKSGIIVFDIDDTLLKADPNTIHIYKKIPGTNKEIALTTAEYAEDADAADPAKKSWFDYREFRDEKLVYKSIISAMPLIKNLRIMDSYLDAGYDFCFLTARGCEDVLKDALDDFLMRKTNGQLQKLGDAFKKTLSHAVNDDYKHYPGYTDAEKKGNVLRDLAKQYSIVVFVDDDKKNIEYARSLNIKNLRVISAWK